MFNHEERPDDCQVLKTTGEHFTSRARTPLPNNSSGNKRKGNNGSWPAKPNNPSGKPCYKCLKLDKEGEGIPDYITTNHTPEACNRTKFPKFKKDNAAYFRDKDSKKEESSGTLSKVAVNQIVQAMQASNKPAKGRQQVLIQNGEDGYFVPKRTANVMHVDAILDSGATASIFPLNYHNLSKFFKYPTPSHATMAASTSKLTLYGTAMYGSTSIDLRRSTHWPTE